LTSTLQFDSEADRELEVRRLERRLEATRQTIACIRERIEHSVACSVCLEDFTPGAREKTVVPCCSNAFCFPCITRWITQAHACPLCKARLGADDLRRVDVAVASAPGSGALEPESPRARMPASKLEALEEILQQQGVAAEPEASAEPRPPRKVLIFSAYENTFVQVQALLTRLGMHHRMLRGNGTCIESILRDYRTGSLNVLLVNTRHYGSGLNLENTTDVVMFHKFDDELEKQVIGRAQRCGRTVPVTLWYLLHENEVEDVRRGNNNVNA
jgi:SNF2 family DNA or RNA helicase